MFELDEKEIRGARIKVIGVGGGGGNAINTMILSGMDGVEFIAANTDMQALEKNLAPLKLQIGSGATKGRGAGANPEVGRSAAAEDYDRIRESLIGADMVFVACGLGGGTGTGAAPVIARAARDLGALTVAVVTKPFLFEGLRRARNAEEGLLNLRADVDALIVVPNQRLLTVSDENTTLIDAFRLADDVLLTAAQGICDLITVGGYVNVDFADVRAVMADMGMALMGTGRARGDRRAEEAAELAISSPLLEDASIDGATGVLINVTGGLNLGALEVHRASSIIQAAAHPDANIIWGTVIDEAMGDEIKVTVIATGFDRADDRRTAPGGYEAEATPLRRNSYLGRPGPEVVTSRPAGRSEPAVQVGAHGPVAAPAAASAVAVAVPAPAAPPATPARAEYTPPLAPLSVSSGAALPARPAARISSDAAPVASFSGAPASGAPASGSGAYGSGRRARITGAMAVPGRESGASSPLAGALTDDVENYDEPAFIRRSQRYDGRQ